MQIKTMRAVRHQYRRSVQTQAEIIRLEKRIEATIFWLIFLGVIAMWAFVGYQLNLLEQVH